jgi:hypothetical protein
VTRRLPPRALTWLACLACATSVACGDSVSWSGQPPAPDFAAFQSEVYPLLLRDCAFSRCHGDPSRFFRVLGPGRTRLLPTTKPEEPATAEEIAFSYERARSMLADAARVEQSLLLRKPLEPSAGGQGHDGVDSLGHNVYRQRGSQGYATLLQWARSRTSSAPTAQGSAGAAGAP